VRVRFENTERSIFLSRGAAPVTIDVGALAEDERCSFEQMVKDARFFELPARIPAPRGAQHPACHITIEAGGRRHSISVSDPVQGPALRRLVDRLRELGKASQPPSPRPWPTSRARTWR
jgi:hypothetical protein